MSKALTNDEFIQRIKIINSNIEPIESYIGARTKILFRCKICDFEWETKPETILYKKSGCPKCSNHYHRSDTEYKEDIYKILPTITVLSEIKTNQTKFLCRCNIDGYEWYSDANTLLKGHGCRECYRTSLIRDKHDFAAQAKISNNYISLLEEYENSRKKILVKCNMCGNQYRMLPHNILKGQKCKKCYSKEQTRTHEDFVQEVQKIHKNIKITKPYINSTTNVSCECISCGYKWEAHPNNLLRGYGCARCAGHIKTHEDFIKKFNEINPSSNITFLNKYVDSKSPLLCKCDKDLFEWNALPSNLLKGTGCPRCKESKGEKLITDILTKNNICLIRQKTFDELYGIGNGNLSYDFYIPNLNILIEFQGEQHYKPINYFGGEKQFEIQQEHDKRKREYAKDNGIKLIEIPYWDFENIEEILSKELGLIT